MEESVCGLQEDNKIKLPIEQPNLKLVDIKESFEQSFLSIPDVDETLINKDGNGKYLDKEVEFYYYWYKQGFQLARIEALRKVNETIVYKD